MNLLWSTSSAGAERPASLNDFVGFLGHSFSFADFPGFVVNFPIFSPFLLPFSDLSRFLVLLLSFLRIAPPPHKSAVILVIIIPIVVPPIIISSIITIAEHAPTSLIPMIPVIVTVMKSLVVSSY